MTVRWFPYLTMAAALGGCAAGTPAPVPEAPADAAEVRLIETALRAEAALTRLARVRSARHPLEPVRVPRIVPQELLRRMTIDWIGPPDILAEKLASAAGFTFDAAGPQPVRPVIVEIAARERPIIMILRDLGIRAGRQASVVVDVPRRAVRVEWAENRG